MNWEKGKGECVCVCVCVCVCAVGREEMQRTTKRKQKEAGGRRKRGYKSNINTRMWEGVLLPSDALNSCDGQAIACDQKSQALGKQNQAQNVCSWRS